jgi:hypothetical protein
MTKSFVVGLIALLVVPSKVLAQEDPEFQKWLKQQQSEYKAYVDKHDREFAEFLKKEWRGVELMRGSRPDSKPKPPTIPVFVPPAGEPNAKLPDERPTRLAAAPVQQPTRTPITPPSAERNANTGSCELQFFETAVNLSYDRSLVVSLDGPLDNKSISGFWEAMSQANAKDLITQLQYYRKALKLNDWGFAQLCFQTGQSLENGDHNRATLFTWFLLTHTGYDARVGYANGRAHLLVTTGTRLFNTPFFTFAQNGIRYYAVSFEANIQPPTGEISTYEGTFPSADKAIDFAVMETPVLGKQSGERTLIFNDGARRYSVSVSVDRGAVNYFRNYPQTDFPVYFAASVSPSCKGSLVSALKPLMEGKSQVEGVNLLLHFTQTAFEYKTDAEQFKCEKPLFPDETIFYPYSDCEDRAILFAFLVRELLQLEVVGLDYPAHIATAIRFRENVKGDAVIYDGVRYVICDPTYINADVGDCMPDLRSTNPTIVTWRNKR